MYAVFTVCRLLHMLTVDMWGLFKKQLEEVWILHHRQVDRRIVIIICHTVRVLHSTNVGDQPN